MINKMKNALLIFLILFFFVPARGQEDKIRQLETIGKVWGETYLLHPSVVRNNIRLNWERVLIDYLDDYHYMPDKSEFTRSINREMLSLLQDPLTRLQSRSHFNKGKKQEIELKRVEYYDHIRLSATFLSEEKNWLKFDSILTKRRTEKPLIVDIRLESPVKLNSRSKSCFDFIIGFFTAKNLSMGSVASRFHFGWDEMNNREKFSQKWKVTNRGDLTSIRSVSQNIRKKYPDFDFSSTVIIDRPVYFLVNNTSVAYFGAYFKALREARQDIKIVWEKEGLFYENSRLLNFDYGFDFFLNPSVMIPAGFNTDYESEKSISKSEFSGIIHTKVVSAENKPLSFELMPRVYPTASDNLSFEYKMLGLFKVWAVFKYFHPLLNHSKVEWDAILPEYIRKIMDTRSDKAYYQLLQELISKINDKQAGCHHSSLADSSNAYIMPIWFDRINGQMIVTEVGENITGNHQPKPGDEILKIDGKSIRNMLKDFPEQISSEKEGFFHNPLFNPAYHMGPKGSKMKLTFRRGTQIRTAEIPRSVSYCHFKTNVNKMPDRMIREETGYLNPAKFSDFSRLEAALRSMEDTKGLIVDLRHGSFHEDFSALVTLLAGDSYTEPLVHTPVLDAASPEKGSLQVSRINFTPDTSFTYNKPVAVLINGNSSAGAEELAIHLSGIERVFFVGEESPGMAGEKAFINLPGGGEISFTGQVIRSEGRVSYGNMGLQPEVEVSRTPEGIRNGKDEILEEAIKRIQKRYSE
jgi:C-terminal processing protease CtpA/Prc